MKNKISILFPLDNSITVNYTLYPLWVSKYRSKFDFYTSAEDLIKKDKNSILVLFGKYIAKMNHSNKKELVYILRNKYKKFVFFDDLDGSESHFLDLLPFFDLYFKKQLFKNKLNYLDSYYGNRIYTDFYYKKFGITENPLPIPLPKFIGDVGELHKFRLGWNLGIGQISGSRGISFKFVKHIYKFGGSFGMGLIQKRFPKSKKIPNPINSKCQARFGFEGYRPTVGYQRKLFLELVKNNPLIYSGKIPFSEYQSELKNTKAVLSPFGWGEVCFRDFEAIINGSVLVKPNMDHIFTWPDLYQADKTYIPISWDGSDMVEKIENILSIQEKINDIRFEAWSTLKASYSRLDNRVSEFIDDIENLK